MKLFLLIIICCSTVMGCNNKITTAKTMHNIDLQGHRGCRGLMPENTIAAMIFALELGVTTLEMDVVITADNQVILSHEPFFNHEVTTKPNGTFVTEAEEKTLNIYKMQYDSVLHYDVGLKTHPRFVNQKKVAAVKPLLSTVFEIVKKYCVANKRALPNFNSETKCMPATDDLFHPKPEKFVTLLMQVIQEAKMEKNVFIQSFDIRTLQVVHQKYKNISTVLLIEDNEKRSFSQQIEDLGFIPNFYSPHYSLVNAQLIKACNIKNILVIPWTVNDLPTMQKLKNLGVAGLISDYPNLYKQLK